MLDLLSSETICKSFLPLKIIFSEEKKKVKKKSTVFLLRATVVFCCSNRVCEEVALVLLRYGFVKSKPCSCLKCMRKLSVTSWISVLQKPLHLPQKAASGAGGLLMHCITSLKLILMQWNTQLPKTVWCLCLQLHLKFWVCMYLCQLQHKNSGFLKQSLMTRKTRPKEASVVWT